MNINYVKNKLLNGQQVIGIWSIINSPVLVEIAGTSGLDFQILDMEHGIYDLSLLENCIRACELSHCSPLIRVPELNQSIIQNVLDMGAHGVIVPQIKNYNDAFNVALANKFPPEGNRGYNPFVRAGLYQSSKNNKLNNDFGLVSVIIENEHSYTQIDKILTIKQLDLLYLGVYDMSYDMGFHGNVQHPKILKFVQSSIMKIHKAGKFSGVMVSNASDIKKYIDMGVDFLVYGVDANSYYHALNSKVKEFQQIMKEIV